MAATKLKHLKVTNVDFVDEGANPDAHIQLFKRKDDGAEEPDPVEAPVNEKPDGSALKRFFAAIGKAIGMKHEEMEAAMDEIEKQHIDFSDAFREREMDVIREESMQMTYALHDSIMSILYDRELTDSASREDAMQNSLNEFVSAVTSSIPQWSAGKTSGIAKRDNSNGFDLETARAAVASLNSIIEKNGSCDDVDKDETAKDDNESKGDDEMKIDKSKMTSAERAFFEDLEKRYGTEEPAAEPAGEAAPATEPAADVTKSATQPAEKPAAPAATAEDSNDVYKGLHPAVKAELESLRKFREAQEERELREVAKKYTIIGKKEDELLPVLKSLKAAGGTAYDDMIAMLDSTVSAVEKSGVFAEIGKSGGAGNENGAWARAEAKAAEIQKSKGVSKAKALDEVFQNDPALAAECEKEE